MDINNLKSLLRRYNIKPNFTYGQNFLLDEIVLEDMVDAAGVTSDDQILEIGPGIGNLTRLLCERAKLVLSVEKDPKFLPVLKGIKKDFKNFRWEIADALQYDFQTTLISRGSQTAAADIHADQRADRRIGSASGLASYKVVANIPYYITGKILQNLLTAKFKPASITILTQKEVARNITAKAGELSVLAISVQLFGEPKIIRYVPAKSFFPAPKVDSAILSIKLFEKPKFDLGNEKNFFRVMKACFAGKRKQIHNTLQNNLGLKKERVDEILVKLKINPAARPQELSIEEWVELTKKISNYSN